jgi:hypothetical protein
MVLSSLPGGTAMPPFGPDGSITSTSVNKSGDHSASQGSGTSNKSSSDGAFKVIKGPVVRQASFCPNGQYMVCGASNATFQVWKIIRRNTR